jgi:hypothetical protein
MGHSNIFRQFYSKECTAFECDVLILIDHISREMEFAISLAAELRKVGMNVEIITTKFNLYRIPILYRASFIITPWVYKNREANILYSVKSLKPSEKATVINLHFEQIAGEASDSFLLPIGRAKNCVHLSWSKGFTDKLLSVGVDQKKILEFGNPKLDFYGEFAGDLSEKKVLIAANAFHLLTTEEKRRFEKNGVNVSGIGYAGKENYSRLLSELPSVLDEFRDVAFIYRPHPSFSERDSKNPALVKLQEQHSNFRVEFSGSISKDILKSNLIISFHSTAYLEAVKCNKAFAVIRFNEVGPKDDLPDLMTWPIRITCGETFRQIVSEYAADPSSNALHNVYSELSKAYYMDSPENVAQRLTNFICSSGVRSDFWAKRPHLGVITRIRLIFLLKFIFNFASTHSKWVRTFLLSRKDYRVQNLAYMWGKDAFDKRHFE